MAGPPKAAANQAALREEGEARQQQITGANLHTRADTKPNGAARSLAAGTRLRRIFGDGTPRPQI